MATPPQLHLKEGAHEELEEGQQTGTSDFTMEGVTGVGSELERVHIAEKNKAMAAKLKVSRGSCFSSGVYYLYQLRG